MEAPHDSSVSPRGLQEVPEVTLSQLSCHGTFFTDGTSDPLFLGHYWLLSAHKTNGQLYFCICKAHGGCTLASLGLGLGIFILLLSFYLTVSMI